MIITPLTHTPLAEITRCFNEAFSDYFEKFNVTEQYLRDRWKIGRVNYDLSFGFFIEGTMRGFIMHGIDHMDGILTAHNVATGIEPLYRGKGHLGKIYDVAIAALQEHGVQFSTLEVISKNKKAIRAYEKTGFRIRPCLLHCFKGQAVFNLAKNENVNIVKSTSPDFEKYKFLRDYEPTWEMTEQALGVTPSEFIYYEMYQQSLLIGYLIFAPKTNSILQFGILPSHRRQGFGKILFKNLFDEYKTFRVNNVPETAVASVSFLKSIGLKNHLDQYIMEKKFNN